MLALHFSKNSIAAVSHSGTLNTLLSKINDLLKFDDEKIVYAFVKSAIRHALAQYSVAPALDFSLDANIQQMDAVAKPFTSSLYFPCTLSDLFPVTASA